MTLNSTQVEAVQMHDVAIAALSGRTSESKAEGHLQEWLQSFSFTEDADTLAGTILKQWPDI
jgi:hypothetical protein